MKRDIDGIVELYIEYIKNLDYSNIKSFESIKTFIRDNFILCSKLDENILCETCINRVSDIKKYYIDCKKFALRPDCLLPKYECNYYNKKD
jgi:hypothetical protein